MARIAMTLLALAGVSIIALTVNASESLAKLDENKDEMLSYGELLVGYPDLSEDDFNALDVNADGLLNIAEQEAAIDAGILAKMDE